MEAEGIEPSTPPCKGGVFPLAPRPRTGVLDSSRPLAALHRDGPVADTGSKTRDARPCRPQEAALGTPFQPQVAVLSSSPATRSVASAVPPSRRRES